MMQFPYSVSSVSQILSVNGYLWQTDFQVGVAVLEVTTLYSCRFLSFVFVAVVGTVCFFTHLQVFRNLLHIYKCWLLQRHSLDY